MLSETTKQTLFFQFQSLAWTMAANNMRQYNKRKVGPHLCGNMLNCSNLKSNPVDKGMFHDRLY